MIDLNKLAADIHEESAKWWVDIYTGEPIERNKGEVLMLIVSEISEALEAERKDLMDDHLPHRRGAEVELADAVIRILDASYGFNIALESDDEIWFDQILDDPENKGGELYNIVWSLVRFSNFIYANLDGSLDDCLQNIIAYCNTYGYDLWGAVEEKRAYNRTREDHKLEARKLSGGKKF